MARIDPATNLALIEAIRKGRAARVAYKDLAAQLGYSMNTIKRRSADLGITKTRVRPNLGYVKELPVDEIRELRVAGATQMSLAAKYGCSQSKIANICRDSTAPRKPRIAPEITALNLRGLNGYLSQRRKRREELQARIARGGRA